jgi:hypothetical protein
MKRDGRTENGEGKSEYNAFAEIENKTCEGSHRKRSFSLREGRGMREGEGKKWKLGGGGEE